MEHYHKLGMKTLPLTIEKPIMETTTTESSSRWNQIFSLMGLNAAIVISWIAYHNYQPVVLKMFNFTELSYFLVVAQAVILVFIPVVAGWFGDYMIRKNSNYFIVTTVGISVTAMVFMCVAFILGSTTMVNLTAALPVMIVIWLISMNIFHSPANSMLDLFAPARRLPAAMAMMVLTTDLLYAFEPVVVNIVDALGPVYTFAFGGALLIITGYIFRKTTQNVNFSRAAESAEAKESNFMAVVLTGLVFGLVYAIVKNFMGEWLMQKSDIDLPFESGVFVSIVLVTAAVAAWPLSFQVDRIGLQKGVVIGLIGAVVTLALVYLLPMEYPALVCALLTGVFLSLASVSAFPFALKNLSVKHITIGTGIFFGCFELAEGVISVLSHP
jgi:MFS family permease